MSVLFVRNVLPVLTSVAATLFLATAVPESANAVSPPSLARAEVQRCVMAGRDTDACRDEADGKALVERAEWLARDAGPSRRAGR